MNHYKLENNKEKGIKKRKINDKKSKIYIKHYIFLMLIPLFIFINIYLSNNNPKTLELIKKIKELESKIKKWKKK